MSNLINNNNNNNRRKSGQKQRRDQNNGSGILLPHSRSSSSTNGMKKLQRRQRGTRPFRHSFLFSSSTSNNNMISCCFYLIILLIFVELCCLLVVGFLSDNLDLNQWISSSDGPMESIHELAEDIKILTSLQKIDRNNDVIEILKGDDDDDLAALEDHMTDKAEAQLLLLEQQQQNETNKDEDNNEEDDDDEMDGPGIFDYYNMSHITYQTPNDSVILIVGGSDGSGTRAFVDVLGRLAVPMIVDDGGTLDVHGKMMFGGKGWPPLASSVLQELGGSSNQYTYEQLSDSLKNASHIALNAMKESFAGRAEAIHNRSNVSLAEYVTYGFKAPVTMLLVPILLQTFKKVKYLHVVRDGRDVAFSSNTSPVDKFYKYAYKDAEEREQKYTKEFTPVKAIQLWNDWNTGLYKYGMKRTNGHDFDYLVMRTEDLLDPHQKFESLLQLSNFVGSTKAIEDLCCLSRKTISDMGQSSRGGGWGGRQRWPRGRFVERFHGGFREMLQTKNEFHDFLRNRYSNKDEKDVTAGEKLQAIREFRKNKRDGSQQQHENGRPVAQLFQERASKNTDHELEQRLTKQDYQDLHDSYAKHHAEKEDRLKTISHQVAAKLRDKIANRYHDRNVGGGVGDEPLNLRGHARAYKLPDREDGGDGLPLDPLVEQRAGHGRLHIRGRRGRRRGNVDSETANVFGRRRLTSFRDSLLEKLSLYGGGSAGDRHGRHSRRFMGAGQQQQPQKEPPKAVMKRYGRWMEQLKGKPPELSRMLHEEGREGLEIFGYEPRQRFMVPPTEEVLLQCDESVECDNEGEVNGVKEQ